MFDIEEMLEEGFYYHDIWKALDACESALASHRDNEAGKAINNMVRNALDIIEMKEACGEFDDV